MTAPLYGENLGEQAPPAMSADDEREVCAGAAGTALFYAGTGVAAMYFVLAFGHAVSVPSDYRNEMVASALFGFVGAGAVGVYCRRNSPALRLAHPLCLWIIGILAVNSALHLGLSGEMKHTSNLAFVVVAAGCLFLSRAWWAVAVAGIIGVWVVVSGLYILAPDWQHYAFMHFIALCLSATVLEMRRGGVLLGARLRLSDAMRLKELEAALQDVRRLEGLIPICAWCKKVRDDAGFWDEVESFVASRTSASFTHSVCPNCVEKHFQGNRSK